MLALGVDLWRDVGGSGGRPMKGYWVALGVDLWRDVNSTGVDIWRDVDSTEVDIWRDAGDTGRHMEGRWWHWGRPM